MKLSDIMSNAGLSFYAQVALVIFLAVFIGIIIYTFAPSRNREMQAASRLPLEDDVILTPRDPKA
jgi:cbb3-type cytochrome oxidase subunit 3